jgi:HNH endonuclease/AP2 domain
MKDVPPLTQTQVRELFHYDRDSGIIRWAKPTARHIRVGDISGAVNKKSGYRLIQLDGLNYPAHLIAWVYMTGEWAPRQIDHRDLDRANNRWDNLRRATLSQNAANRRRQRNNTSGFKGAHLHGKSGRWRAVIRKDGRGYYLGSFTTPRAAHEAYMAAARDLFGEFARAE